MTNDDERGGRGVKNAENLMTSYVNDPKREFNFALEVNEALYFNEEGWIRYWPSRNDVFCHNY